MADVVSVILQLQNVRAFISGAEGSSKAIGKVGTEAEKSGKKAKIGWKGVAKWAGAGTAIYGAQRFLRGAVTATEELGKSTLALNRVTGMDIKTSSQWAAVLKTRGISAQKFGVGIVKLSRETEKSRLGAEKEMKANAELVAQYREIADKGGKKAPAALAKLREQMARVHETGLKSRYALAQVGVGMDVIAKGDTEQILLQAADGLSKIQNPAKRAALAQQLFGRQGQALAPILFKGSKAIREQLGIAEKYGASMSGKTADDIKEQMARQRELQLAYLGTKVQLGTALLPVIGSVTELIVTLTRAMQPLTKNALLFKIAIVALVAAFIAYKIAMIAAAIATTVFNVAAAPVVLIVLAIVAGLILLAAGVYLVIKHWGWFKKKAMDVWGWLKANWPYLLGILFGPIGIATALIIKNFDKIKAGVKLVGDAFVKAFDVVKGAVKSGINFLIRGWNSLQFKVPGFKKGPVKFGGFTLGVPKIPELAAGGVIQRGGSAIVGDAGPELVNLPAGASVAPLGGFPITVRSQLVVDRRVLAEAVGTYTADKLARR